MRAADVADFRALGVQPRQRTAAYDIDDLFIVAAAAEEPKAESAE